jgi:hypothetical protein
VCSKVSGDMVRLMCTCKLSLMFSCACRFSTSCSCTYDRIITAGDKLGCGGWGLLSKVRHRNYISWYEDLPCAVSSLRWHRSPRTTAPGHWPSETSNDQRSLCLRSSFVLCCLLQKPDAIPPSVSALAWLPRRTLPSRSSTARG